MIIPAVDARFDLSQAGNEETTVAWLKKPNNTWVSFPRFIHTLAFLQRKTLDFLCWYSCVFSSVPGTYLLQVLYIRHVFFYHAGVPNGIPNSSMCVPN